MEPSGSELRLRNLMVTVMRGCPPLTERQIIHALHGRFGVRTDLRSVRLVLRSGSFAAVRQRFGFLRRPQRWVLVEAGPVDDPGTAGMREPLRPRPSSFGAGAAVELTFLDEDPPPSAIGRAL